MSGESKRVVYRMPGEEELLFRHFYLVAAFVVAVVGLVRHLLGGEMLHGMGYGAAFIAPFVALYHLFRGRMARTVILDAGQGRATFVFAEEERNFEADLSDIRLVRVRFYLTFLVDGRKVMIKRPPDKKEVIRFLSSFTEVDRGWFGITG